MRTFTYLVCLLGMSLGGLADATDPLNVLMICVDDLRPELRSFGKEYINSPNIDALASRGRAFHRHYVQAPTCGASRYALLTGMYGPSGNEALFDRAKRIDTKGGNVPPSMPEWFRSRGFTTVSIGKVSHHPGGRGGVDWDDDTQPEMPGAWTRHRLPSGPWMHPRGAMHGLANGEIRGDSSDMDVFQSTEGPDTIYPDGLITAMALDELKNLSAESAPFFLAVGLIRPHLPFGAPAKYYEQYRDVVLPAVTHTEKPLGKTTWHKSSEFMRYNRWDKDPNEDAEFATAVRRHYAACVSFADAQVGRLIEQLDSLGLRNNTIVVLWGDHGWHLGEHAVWGKHTLFDESLRSPLIIDYPGIPMAGVKTDSIVETVDIFPTICDLAGLPIAAFSQGQTLRPILETPSAAGHAAVSYAAAKTICSDTHRLILHPRGEVELYDHRTDRGETKNVAVEQPEMVKTLRNLLNEKMARR